MKPFLLQVPHLHPTFIWETPYALSFACYLFLSAHARDSDLYLTPSQSHVYNPSCCALHALMILHHMWLPYSIIHFFLSYPSNMTFNIKGSNASVSTHVESTKKYLLRVHLCLEKCSLPSSHAQSLKYETQCDIHIICTSPNSSLLSPLKAPYFPNISTFIFNDEQEIIQYLNNPNFP